MSQTLSILFALALVALVVFFVLRSNQKRSRKGGGVARPTQAKAKASKGDDGLAFMTNGTNPELDDKGRVIVRLDAGSFHEWRINVRGGYEHLIGRGQPKDDSEDVKSRTVRGRLVRVSLSGGTYFEVSTPSGEPIGRLGGDFEPKAIQFFDLLESALRPLDARLASGQFVYDVAVTAELSLDSDDDDKGNEVFEWSLDSAYVRIKDPVGVDIK